MQVHVEKLSPVLVELKVEVPAQRVRDEVDKAYASLQRTARVKGFRPGKAPRHIIAHLFSGRIHADVAQRLMDTTLDTALAAQQVQPLSQPDLAPTELRPDDPFSYRARFEVRPEIASVTWEGFAVKRPKVDVTDDAVDGELGRLRREHSTLQAPSPERAARAGDRVRIAFEFDVDGEPQKAVGQEIDTEIGSGEVFSEIDGALAGMSVGERKDVSLTFSDRHVNPAFRGKPAVFHVTLKDVKERILPEIDDEFAKDCGDFADLAALRASLRDKLEKEQKQKADEAVAEQLIVALCKANTVPVPPTLVDQQAQLTEREVVAAARRQGQRLEVNAELRQRVRADAEVKVRAGLLMAEIAKAKEVKITDADIEKGFEELAEQTGKNIAKVKAEYRTAKQREMLVAMILEDKILDLLEGAAQITEE